MEIAVLIVGGGPAGCAAGLYAAREGLRPVILAGAGGQLDEAGAVENYPGVPARGGAELAGAMRHQAEEAGALIRPEQAVRVDLRERAVWTASGEYRAGALIYAAGAAPRTLGVPGEEELRGRGVSYCAVCDGAFFRGRVAAVVGGGRSAVSEALTLSRLCRKVYVVHRRDALRAGRGDVEALERAGNVEFLWNARVEAVEGESRVTGLRVQERRGVRTLECGGVFVAIGRRPSTGLLRGQLALDTEGYVMADESTRTEAPGVFAAGDVRAKPLRQIVTAVSDGAVAAHMAAAFLKTGFAGFYNQFT